MFVAFTLLLTHQKHKSETISALSLLCLLPQGRAWPMTTGTSLHTRAPCPSPPKLLRTSTDKDKSNMLRAYIHIRVRQLGISWVRKPICNINLQAAGNRVPIR